MPPKRKAPKAISAVIPKRKKKTLTLSESESSTESITSHTKRTNSSAQPTVVDSDEEIEKAEEDAEEELGELAGLRCRLGHCYLSTTY
jgi:hypothetical protein